MKASQNPLDLTELKHLGLSTDELYALLEFIVQKTAGHDPAYAEALTQKVLQLGRECRSIRFDRMGHPAGQIQALFQHARTSRLTRKRKEQDAFIHVFRAYVNVFGCLQHAPRGAWPDRTDTYWTAVGKPGRIPDDIHQTIVTELARVRSPHQATLVILSACLETERKSLEKRLRRHQAVIRSRR